MDQRGNCMVLGKPWARGSRLGLWRDGQEICVAGAEKKWERKWRRLWTDQQAGQARSRGAWGQGARVGEKVKFWCFSLEWWKLWKGFKQKKITLGIHFWKVTLDQRDMWLHWWGWGCKLWRAALHPQQWHMPYPDGEGPQSDVLNGENQVQDSVRKRGGSEYAFGFTCVWLRTHWKDEEKVPQEAMYWSCVCMGQDVWGQVWSPCVPLKHFFF